MDILVILQQMLVLLLLMVVGFVLRHLKILEQEGSRLLGSLVLNLSLPALIITGMLGGGINRPNTYLLYVLAVSAGAYLLMGAVSLLTPFVLRAPREDRGSFAAIPLFGNVTFMGFPLLISLFGAESLFYATLVNMIFGLLLFSLGIKLLAGNRTKFSFRLLLNTPLAASALALGMSLSNLQLPFVLHSALSHLGGLTTPLAMILLGFALAGMNAREVFCNGRVYALAAVKLLLVPLLVYAVLRLFVTDPLLLGAVVVLAAMPVATVLPILCRRYNGNQELVSQVTFLSTLLSLITIPLLIYLLGF